MTVCQLDDARKADRSVAPTGEYAHRLATCPFVLTHLRHHMRYLFLGSDLIVGRYLGLDRQSETP
jgi:hypothetical protein